MSARGGGNPYEDIENLEPNNNTRGLTSYRQNLMRNLNPSTRSLGSQQPLSSRPDPHQFSSTTSQQQQDCQGEDELDSLDGRQPRTGL